MRSGWIMLGITTLLYLIAAFYSGEKALTALEKSLGILQQIVPIILVVFFLMGLLNTFINPKKIAANLGRSSRLRGWSIALAGGILSHGPGYIWYPLLADLRSHGARNGLIVAFFYARAIKLPWLPVMVSYFGLTFSILLCFYILIAAWMQGLIAEKMLARQ